MLQIAIIEDEADLAQQTKDNVVRYLNEHGLEGNIAVFNDGMDIVENYKPIWDILLLDIEMPLLDGMSAAQKIREQDATVVSTLTTRMAKYASQCTGFYSKANHLRAAFYETASRH